MASKGRWLIRLLPLCFLVLILWASWRQDRDFWRSPSSLYLLAQEMSGRGQHSRALELARKALAGDPANPGIATFLGWLLLEGGQPREALEIFVRIRQRHPQAAAALQGQARALDLLDRRPEALALLAEYLEPRPEDQDTLQFAAQLAANQPEDRSLAISYYQRLYRLGHDPQVRRELVDLLVAAERFKEAIPLQEEEVAQFPENDAALHRLALYHYWQRDYQEAGQVYQRLLERVAEDGALRLEAAHNAEAARDVDQALAHYLWLYGRHQGQMEYAVALARLWSQKGRHAEAVAVLAPLMGDRPDHELLRWYALELLLIGEPAKARAAYEAAWQSGDTHQETIINLARLYGQRHHFARAAAFWDEAERRQLVRGELCWEAALAYSYARRYSEAVAILQPQVRRDRNDPKLLLFLAQMYFYQEMPGRAAHYLQAYLREHPGDGDVHGQLADLLALAPETREEALSQYALALKCRENQRWRLSRISLLFQDRRWQEGARELGECPPAEEPRDISDQAGLCLWLGDLEGALARYERLLARVPGDRHARLGKARVLICLRRGPEAVEELRTLRVGQPGVRPDQPGDRSLLAASIEAALATRDWGQARQWALKLFCSQFPDKHRLARDWSEARQWAQGKKEKKKGRPANKGLGIPNASPAGYGDLKTAPISREKADSKLTTAAASSLNREERTWVARALCHDPGEAELLLAADLVLANLYEQRHHHPSLLILAFILPRLPRYEDLARMVYRIPGIRSHSPEYVAALGFFTGNLGRHGGKLDYLLHVLEEYRHHRRPDSPGELLGLADLAMELGEPRHASRYYDEALKLRPGDVQINALKLRCQLSRKEWGEALATLQQQGAGPGSALETARLYLLSGQFEGAKAALATIPPGHGDYPQAQLLLAQTQRRERNYAAALQTLDRAADLLPRQEWLMERACTLEGMGDRRAVDLFEEISRSQPGTPAARVAQARRARSLRDWAGAQRAYALALQDRPQDIELLNELEYIRQQQRPQVAARGLAYPRGERRPEELVRPWQFSRLDREFQGLGLLNRLNPLQFFMFAPALGKNPLLIRDIPVIQPESLGFTDSNRLYGGIFRLAGACWLGKALPLSWAGEYREYNQQNSRLRRGEAALGAGPLSLGDRLQLSGELIGRRYWKRVDYVTHNSALKEARNRLLGSLEVKAALGARTDATLKYSRRDIFDQDAGAYPRLYQSILNLEQARLTTLHQAELSYSHQFLPGLDWRGNLGGAFFSDLNRRLTVYQGLAWKALRQPRMHLELTPHFYLAAYRERRQAYFSPSEYLALGLALDFDRQFFRLPTLILQGAAQATTQHGDWGPALQGLAALQWELVHNFCINTHFYYFREWVDNYRLLTVGLSLQYRF